MCTPTLFVVEDDLAVADALRDVGKLMNLNTEVYESAEQFIESYDGQRPGCLLLDYKLPNMNGITLQAKLEDLGSMLPVIMVSGHANIKTAVKSLKQGALTFLEKPFELDDLCREITTAVELNLRRRREAAEQENARSKLAQLTPKEREVFDLIAAGLTNAEMSKQLGLSVRAIEDRRARMLKRLGIDNLQQIIRLHKAAAERPTSNSLRP